MFVYNHTQRVKSILTILSISLGRLSNQLLQQVKARVKKHTQK